MGSDGRAALVAAAERWLNTPYHHAARCRGAGVDCVGLLAEVYEEAGLAGHVELPYYPCDWFLHRGEERFLTGVLEAHLHEVAAPLPGDVALFKMGRCYAHGGIVTGWPLLIHACAPLGRVVRGDATRRPLLTEDGRPREVKFYSVF